MSLAAGGCWILEGTNLKRVIARVDQHLQVGTGDHDRSPSRYARLRMSGDAGVAFITEGGSLDNATVGIREERDEPYWDESVVL